MTFIGKDKTVHTACFITPFREVFNILETLPTHLPHEAFKSVTHAELFGFLNPPEVPQISRQSIILEPGVSTPEVMAQTSLMRDRLRLLYCTLNEGEC